MTFRAYEAIAALAGSGKTYQLTSRYIALLALGVEPSRILAVTFTRKAAGEIFDRLVRRLALAALTEAGRAELEAALRAHLGAATPPVTCARARDWLATLLAAMPRLRLGTIDSLFVSILKAYALELGLPPRQELLEGAALERARAEALERAFDQAGADPEARDAFREAFKETTAGERKQVRDAIFDAVRAGHELFLDLPDPDAWGAPARIWPTAPWWRARGAPDPAAVPAAAAGFPAEHPGLLAGAAPRYIKLWTEWLGALAAGDWDGALDAKLAGLLLPCRDDLAAGRATIKYYKNINIAGAPAIAAHGLLAAAARGAFDRLLARTRGLRRLLEAYERACQAGLRARGRLTFADVPLLLGRMGAQGLLTDIQYRLDGRIDHWMLDEFQDTNARQWRVIGNLADEVLQSAEGDRSFFYVGDVKQAIYAWRGGEATLFEAVRAFYGARFGAPTVLDVSWRSSPVVLDAVNRAFGTVAATDSLGGAFPAAAQAWAARWQPHRAAPVNARLPGRVELIEVSPCADTDEDPRLARACDLVADLLARGARSIGVLTRSNRYGDRVADALRRRRVPVRRETQPRLLDNGVVAALLALLRLADHPADEQAPAHLALGPLPPALARRFDPRGGDPDAWTPARWRRLATRLRGEAAARGVAGLLGEVLDACRDAGLITDDFIALRLRQLLDAASAFDAEDGAGPGVFADLAAELTVSDPGVDSRVTVMTIHKAKGLEFDAVVLPELEGAQRQWTFVRPGELKVGGRAGAGAQPLASDPDANAWVLPFPRKTLAAADPEMERFAAAASEGRVAEELCLLYVAMTRARQGLYMIVNEPPRESRTLYGATFLRETLRMEAQAPAGMLFAQGDPDWPAAPVAGRSTAEAAPAIVTRPPPAPPSGARNLRRRLVSRTPTDSEAMEAWPPAHALFQPVTAGLERGLALHELFRRVEWSGDGAADAALASYTAEIGACPEEARREFQAALATPAIVAALARPATPDVALWREQAFEVAVENEWISGRMDRVVIERDASGRVQAATVMDFKSERAIEGENDTDARARHGRQMAWYGEVLRRLLDLPPAAVRIRLILTRAGRVLDL